MTGWRDHSLSSMLPPPADDEFRVIGYETLMRAAQHSMTEQQSDLLATMLDPDRVSVCWILLPLHNIDDASEPPTHLVEVLMPVQGSAEVPAAGFVRMTDELWQSLPVVPKEWLSDDGFDVREPTEKKEDEHGGDG